MGRPWRHLLVTLTATFAMAVAAPAAGAACAGEDTPYAPGEAKQIKEAVLCLANAERTARGLPELGGNALLDTAAQGHSADMATNDYFAHQNLSGMSPGDRILAAGYDFRAWGENIAAGYKTPRAVMQGWMASDGHCRNILGSAFTQLGVGVASGPSRYGTYWTQNFGSRSSFDADSNAHEGCPFNQLVETSGEASCDGNGAKLRITSLRVSRGKLRVAGRLSGVSCCPTIRSSVKRGKRTKKTSRKLCAGSFVFRLRAPGTGSRAQVTLRLEGAKSARRSIRL